MKLKKSEPLDKVGRIGWIDTLKGICMIVIIMNHIPGESEFAARFTYPFELVGFFFVAGVTFSLKDCFSSFFIAKFKRLVIPVFAFGILNILLSLPFKDFDVLGRLKGIFLQISGKWDDMWFVACLFVMELMYYPIERFIEKSGIKVTIISLLCGMGILWSVFVDKPLPWHIINALLFLPFLMVGKLLTSTGKILDLEKKIKDNIWQVIIPILLYCISILIFNNWPIDVHLLEFGNPFIFVISAILGLTVVTCISIVLNNQSFKYLNKILIFIGANTLVVYGLQSKAISIFDTIFNKLDYLFPEEINISWVLVLICVLPVLALASIIINRWFPFMIGNFNLKKK